MFFLYKTLCHTTSLIHWGLFKKHLLCLVVPFIQYFEPKYPRSIIPSLSNFLIIYCWVLTLLKLWWKNIKILCKENNSRCTTYSLNIILKKNSLLFISDSKINVSLFCFYLLFICNGPWKNVLFKIHPVECVLFYETARWGSAIGIPFCEKRVLEPLSLTRWIPHQFADPSTLVLSKK